MVNTPNTANNNPELQALESQWASLSEGELQQEMAMYYAEGNYEKGDALRAFIKKQKNPSLAEEKYTDFSKKYEKMNEDIKEIREKYSKERTDNSWAEGSAEFSESKRKEEEEVNKIMQDFFKKDMETYVGSNKADIDALGQSKNAEIDRLKAQLSGIVSKGPELREYLSIKRRRLVTINDAIENLKNGKDKENYPKNVLIYLMGLTNTALFGARQSLKRNWFKLTRRWKSDDIKKYLDIIGDKLKVTDKDSLWTKGLKTQLEQHLLDAKKAYIEKQRQSVGM